MNINYDSELRAIRDRLNMAQYATAALSAGVRDVDYRPVYEQAIIDQWYSARLCEWLLTEAPSHQISQLRLDAEKVNVQCNRLVTGLRDHLRVTLSAAAINRPSTNGNGHSNGNGNGELRRRYTAEDVDQITDYLNKLKRAPNWDDAVYLGHMLGRSEKSMWNKITSLIEGTDADE